jgi:hypothetical protein
MAGLVQTLVVIGFKTSNLKPKLYMMHYTSECCKNRVWLLNKLNYQMSLSWQRPGVTQGLGNFEL